MITIYNKNGEVDQNATPQYAEHIEKNYAVLGWNSCFEKAREIAKNFWDPVIALQPCTGLFIVFCKFVPSE